jgi:hypothetical protein
VTPDDLINAAPAIAKGAAAIGAVLARVYADDAAPIPPVDTAWLLASAKGTIGSLVGKWFQR